MRSTSGDASIRCIFFHQLQPRDTMAPTTRGLPNVPTSKLVCIKEVTIRTTFSHMIIM